MHVPYNYLPMQFADYSEIAAGWDELIQSAEFTLGSFMETFEREFAEYVMLGIASRRQRNRRIDPVP